MNRLLGNHLWKKRLDRTIERRRWIKRIDRVLDQIRKMTIGRSGGYLAPEVSGSKPLNKIP